MHIITDTKRLPKPALLIIAAVGWVCVLYLCKVVGVDSWERAQFALATLQGQMPPSLDPFNDRYLAHPWQTLAHCVTGLIFAVLGPLQFVAPLRRKFPLIHRISGRIFLPVGIVSGVAAFAMGLSFPVWGAKHNVAIVVVSSAFMVFAFVNAFRLVRARQYARHREWMMRGFATGLGVALFRVGLNDVLPPLGYDFNQAWDIVMVASFPLILAAAEAWIRLTRPVRSAPAVPATA